MNHTTFAFGNVTVHHICDTEAPSLGSYVLESNGRTAMVECHSRDVADWLSGQGLPEPDIIWHTHVQAEHCLDAQAFGDVSSAVPQSMVELASDRDGFERAARTIWDNPEEWGDTAGREKYSIGGAVIERLPVKPLNVAGTLKVGEVIDWEGAQLQVIALPGHMADAVGLVLICDGKPCAVFIGDLMRYPEHLVNLYDLEHAYGATRLQALPATLRQLADEVDVDLYLPSTGPAIQHGRPAAYHLADRIDHYLYSLTWKIEAYEPTPHESRRSVARFNELADGIYQFDAPGNTIVLIDEAGRGLMVDPGPCDYENPNRVADFVADVQALEDEAGLKTIDTLLITHMHGDHYDLVPQMQSRYSGCKLAAWGPLADLIEAPEKYPYACLLPWYNLGLDAMRVDDRLSRHEPYIWHDVQINTIHLPGHCLIHAAYILEFNGLRLAITGDTVQTNGEAITVDYIFCNHSAPTDELGVPGAMKNLNAHSIDLNIGGHGSRFGNPNAMYEASLKRISKALPALRDLVIDGDLAAACVRPGYRDVTQLLD